MVRPIFFTSVLLFSIPCDLFSMSYGWFWEKEIYDDYIYDYKENSKLISIKNSNFVDEIRIKNNKDEIGKNTERSTQVTLKEIEKRVPFSTNYKKRVSFSELPEKQTLAPKHLVKVNKATHPINSPDFTKIFNNSKEIEKLIYIPSYKFNNRWEIDNMTGVLSKLTKKGSMVLSMPVHNNSPPSYFDWRDKNAVSPVKDQQRCQACWAFSAVANIESMLKIYLNRKYTLSEQFLIDCDPDSGGCKGKASLLSVFSFIITKLGGVLQYDSYEPYTAKQHECRYHKPPPYPVPVVGMHRVPHDEDAMVEYLYKYGPLSAAINSKSMDNYDVQNGVYIDEPTDEQCPKDQLDHTILIVGYNIYVDKSSGARVPYWIIKNSWGSNWGDKGFYYIVRGRNACGIASDVSFASVV